MDNCSICLDELNSSIVKTSCNHSFHLDCLKQLCKPECPLCKSDISETFADNNIDNKLNMEYLSKQLKNITKEQIEDSTKNIKSLLGDVDENTSEMISLMLTDIKDELCKDNATSNDGSNPINNFLKMAKIAESVAHKMIPKIDPKKVDMEKLLNSTKNIARNR